jgi:RND family efflux transporter MFP subunit
MQPRFRTLILLLLFSFPAVTEAAQNLPALPEAPPIRVAAKALEEVVIASQTRGVVTFLAVKDGSRFHKGDVLVELDCGILEAQTDRARAMARRQKLVQESNERLSRMQSRSQLEASLSRAEAEAASAEALAMERMLDQCRIIAPFDGRVGELMIRETQFVSEGQPLMELLNDSRLVLEFIVPSAWTSWFVPGYSFTVTIDETGDSYQAALSYLGGKVDPVSQSIKVYAVMDGPDAWLLPGMSGTVRLHTPSGRPTAPPPR